MPPPEDDAPFDEDIFDKKVFDTLQAAAGSDDYDFPIGKGIWNDYGLRASIARFRAGRSHRF